MKDLQSLQAEHKAAGARYANALEELMAAYDDLSVIEVVINNANVRVQACQTFRGELDCVPSALIHPVFAPDSSPGARDRRLARSEKLIRQLSQQSR